MLYRVAGKSQESIAEIFNLSQSYISRIEDRSRKMVIEHFTTLQQFKEVYSMSIVGDSYKISFSSKDVMNFNSIFARFLQNMTSAENLPDFKVSCNKERVIIHVPAHPESFSFIAQIIQQIDEYNLTFISDTSTLTENQSVSKKVKSDESEKSIEETVIEVDKSTLTDTTSNLKRGDKQRIVREYMLSKENFTFKELKERFPHIKTGTIAVIVNEAKNKGLIISTGKGKYATKKD